MRSALVLLSLLGALVSAEADRVLYAAYDEGADAVGPGGAVAGILMGDAALAEEGLRGRGLAVGKAGGVSYPSAGFPVERGCLQMWVRADFYGTDEVRRWLFCDADERFKIFKYDNGHLYFQLRTDRGGVHAHASIAWEPSEWHHVACVWENINSGRDDGRLRLYIDGRLAASASGDYPVAAIGGTVLIGCDRAGEEAAEAIIDEMRLFDEPTPMFDFPPEFVDAHDPADLALSQLGATATASTQILAFKGKDYAAEAVIDGSVTGTYWASDFIFHTAQGPEWVEVDLGRERELARIGVHMVRANVGTLLDDFTVSVLRDGEWLPVADVQGYRARVSEGGEANRFGASYGVYWADFEPLVVRKLRVQVPGTTARIHEIEALPPTEDTGPVRGRLEEPGAVNVFDFGGDGSPLADGALPVTATTLYDDEAGYGWESLDGLIAVERGIGFDVTRDFVAGTGDRPVNTFMVKLPPGEYALGIIAGDTEYDVQRFSVVVESGHAWGNMISADRCDVARMNAVAQTRDGKLDVRVFSDDAWLISALVIGPLEKLAEVDARLTEIEHQFALGDPALIKGLIRGEPEPCADPAKPSGHDRAMGYQLFAPSSTAEHVWPTVPPARGTITRELRMRCTPGEYDPVTLAVHALRPLRGVAVSVGRFAGLDRDESPQVDVRLVQCWPQRFKMQRKNQWAVMPELLRDANFHGETWVPEGENLQWWLTVHVPPGTPPGDYRAVVSVSAENGGALELPLILTVYPFELKWPEPMAWGIYYYPLTSRSQLVALDRERLARLARADLRDLRSHGLNTFSFHTGQAIDWAAEPPTFDFGDIEWVMGLAEDVGGFEGPFPLYMSGLWKPEREDAVQIVQRFITDLEALRQERGWPEFLYYPVDEPFAGQKLEDAVPVYEACAAVEGIRTYCTVSQEAADRLAPVLDVRCHASSGGCGYWWPEVYDSAMADGDEFWWYSNCTREYPAVMRFKAGFHHWKNRATGQSYWHYRAIGAAAYCDFDSGPGDHITSYPGVGQPLPTIQWECHREGIDDAKYAWTLELLIAKALASGDPKVQGTAEEASNALERIRDEVHVDLHYYEQKYDDDLAFHYVSDWPPAKYDESRQAIAEQIIKLLEAGVTQ